MRSEVWMRVPRQRKDGEVWKRSHLPPYRLAEFVEEARGKCLIGEERFRELDRRCYQELLRDLLTSLGLR